FDATSVTFEYAARQRVGRYTMSGGRLHIEFISHAVDYGCILSGNGIKLTQTVDYVINDEETVHQATDEYTIYGQK
ncbi:MAG: hypothetical protein LBJ58_01395, partial [Tannerellaceae bacterium]|nr:hypothetical protein [Tannerellaceae bacterium]